MEAFGYKISGESVFYEGNFSHGLLGVDLFPGGPTRLLGRFTEICGR
jgi:hypothetical protein